jgi:hypothetical protein
MRQDFHNLQMRELLDLLVEKTQELSNMREKGIDGRTMESCEMAVRKLQVIIQTRHELNSQINRNNGLEEGG